MPKDLLQQSYEAFKLNAHNHNEPVYIITAIILKRYPREQLMARLEQEFDFFMTMSTKERKKLQLSSGSSYYLLLGLINYKLIDFGRSRRAPTPAEQKILFQAEARQAALEEVYDHYRTRDVKNAWRIITFLALLAMGSFGAGIFLVGDTSLMVFCGIMTFIATVVAPFSIYKHAVKKYDDLSQETLNTLIASITTITAEGPPRTLHIDVNAIEKTCAEYKGPHSPKWLLEIAIPAARRAIKHLEDELTLEHKDPEEDGYIACVCTDSIYSRTAPSLPSSEAIFFMHKSESPTATQQKAKQLMAATTDTVLDIAPSTTMTLSGPYHDQCAKAHEKVIKGRVFQFLQRHPRATADELPKFSDMNSGSKHVELTPTGSRIQFFTLAFDPHKLTTASSATKADIAIELSESKSAEDAMPLNPTWHI